MTAVTHFCVTSCPGAGRMEPRARGGYSILGDQALPGQVPRGCSDLAQPAAGSIGKACRTRTPLIYFLEAREHHYQAIWPVIILEDHRER